MTGPEHYREAEKAMQASAWQRQNWGDSAASDKVARDAYRAYSWEMSRAQVHATLALAAAFADGSAVMRPEERNAWDDATARSEVPW